MRISHQQWQSGLMNTINRSFERMASIDMRRRITMASDDPAGTEQMIRLRSLLSQNVQFQKNTDSASRWLTYSETALGGITDSLREVREMALTAGDATSDLSGMAENLEGIIDQIMLAANTQQGGRYLFSGSGGSVPPFTRVGESIIYNGDDTQMQAAISDSLSLRYNVPGSEIFGASEALLDGSTDWDPEVNWDTNLTDLFDGQGLDTGKIRITDGAENEVVVNLNGAVTLADVRDRIQTAMPNISVTIIDGERLQIADTANPGEMLKVEDLQGGMTGRILGLTGTGMGGFLLSKDLDPTITDATPLTELRGLPSLPLGSINVRIGDALDPVEVDLSGALTVGDLRGILNSTFPELNVGISAGGNRLTIESQGLLSIEITNLEGDDTASLMGLAGSEVPVRPFDLLFELKSALEEEDRDKIRGLLPEIEKLDSRILSIRASVGTRLNLAEGALTTLENRNFTMTETMSEIGDADMAEAIMMYQSAEAVYQASLTMASNIYQLSLAQYL